MPMLAPPARRACEGEARCGRGSGRRGGGGRHRVLGGANRLRPRRRSAAGCARRDPSPCLVPFHGFHRRATASRDTPPLPADSRYPCARSAPGSLSRRCRVETRRSGDRRSECSASPAAEAHPRRGNSFGPVGRCLRCHLRSLLTHLKCARSGARRRLGLGRRRRTRSCLPEGGIVAASDPFGSRAPLGPGLPDYYSLSALLRSGTAEPALDLVRMPVTVKILLENVLRHAGEGIVREADVAALAAWRPARPPSLAPARWRSRSCQPGSSSRTSPASRPWWTWRPCATRWPIWAATRPASTRSCPPIWSSTTRSRSIATAPPTSFAFNVEREYERNGERYQLLRWAQTAFDDLRGVPPGTGIVHQVNLEYLLRWSRAAANRTGRARSPSRYPGRDGLPHPR